MQIDLLDGVKRHPKTIIEIIAALQLIADKCIMVAYEDHRLDINDIGTILHNYATHDAITKGVTVKVAINGNEYLIDYLNK